MAVESFAISAKSLYESGLTYREVAELVGKHPETVRRCLHRLGVSMRSYRDYYSHKVDDDFFKVIDCEVKAYWFGFAAADGCITRSVGDYRAFRVVLSRSDRDMLVMLKNDISYDGSVHDFDQFVKHRGRSYEKSGIWFNNKCFCGNLLDKGWLAFKNNDDPSLLDYVPDDLFRHFVRGFFDGDGCVSRGKLDKSFYFNIVGPRNVLSVIESFISNQLGFRLKGPKESGNIYRIGWNGNMQVAEFGRWLYSDCSRYMQRKLDRFSVLW